VFVHTVDVKPEHLNAGVGVVVVGVLGVDDDEEEESVVVVVVVVSHVVVVVDVEHGIVVEIVDVVASHLDLAKLVYVAYGHVKGLEVHLECYEMVVVVVVIVVGVVVALIDVVGVEQGGVLGFVVVEKYLVSDIDFDQSVVQIEGFESLYVVVPGIEEKD